MQQRILLKVRLETFRQEPPQGIQLDCANQCVDYQGVTVAKLDLCGSYCPILLQRTHSHSCLLLLCWARLHGQTLVDAKKVCSYLGAELLLPACCNVQSLFVLSGFVLVTRLN